MTSPYQAILDNLVTAVVMLDAQLRIVHLNSAAEGLLQISASHASGQPLQDIILHSERILPALNGALEDGQSFTEREAQVRLPDNVSETVDFTVSVLDLEAGAGRGLIIELQTLNRLQRINKDDASFTRQETARQLIRGLAHEVKNPLGGIRGAAQLLERELPDPELKEYTRVIIEEADRLRDLVDRMLGPQHRPDLKPVNIFAVLERVIALVEAEQPNKIAWQRDYDPSLPDLLADDGQLIQALLNILRNACQALRDVDDARICLRARAARQFTIGTIRHRTLLHLDISDNGPGIEPELLERVFFPMISGRAEGTGLGLAITQSIVAQHQGTIQVASRPGNTCFSIYLPFEPVPVDGESTEAR